MKLKRENLATSFKSGENRFTRFLRRQVRQIREGGWRVLRRKIHVLFSALVGLPLSLPVVLLVRLLRPVVVIRFRALRSPRIGHFAANTEVYLCERDAGMHGSGTLDIFYHTSPVSNQQLRKMWDRTLHVSRFAKWPDWLNRKLPRSESHVIPWRRSQDRDIHGLLADTPPHLSFTPEEERLGCEALQKMGIADGVPFVCFHARDSAYLDAVMPSISWRYHDYRDSDIKNYIPAAEDLTGRGYFTIRMGAVVKEALNTPNPRLIDYATNGRTDLLDIFLGAKCHFFIGSPSGLLAIPMIFRRPVVWVNFIPLEYAPTWNPNDLFIPKKLWLREERRFLTFREILESEIGRFYLTQQYEQLGIEVIENTPQEITAVAVEMDERLKGTWKKSEEDEQLQQRFWSFFKPSELHGVFQGRIGAEFLRQNRELLD